MADPTAGSVLTPALVDQLVALADGAAVRGIAVLGSAARGDASRWSDVDVESTVSDPAAKWPTRPSFIGSRLIMSHAITRDEQVAQLSLPDKAIWAAPSYAAMRILVDRDGELERLRQACQAFDYAPLRPAAAAYLREKAGSACEYVFKIRDALSTRDESKALHAAAALTSRCERLTSVAFLVPIRTENEYYRVVRQAAGPAWTGRHRAAFGLDGGDAFTQGAAACALFRETIRLIDDRLDAGARAIVGPTLEIAP
ncbi:MAG TPA: nucleotidyltransferase domain-containing protein [Candidatus Limnocylindria bacterium]|nr:nucleotidyltransferase domain-containing protein [Candidatus Limnocylindria bacterium]